MSLRNKKILITAGPTWVPIDNVRVISNIATGETGTLLAERLQRLGAKVTLLLGQVEFCCLNKNIRVIRFRFFDELKDKITQELKSKKYDVVIQTAAVCDYKPRTYYRQKVKSGFKLWKLDLVPTPKIIDLIKKIDPSIFLVGFKFEPQVNNKEILIDKAKGLIIRARLDLAVANTVEKNRYRAYIIDQDKTYGPFRNKNTLTTQLISLMRRDLCSS